MADSIDPQSPGIITSRTQLRDRINAITVELGYYDRQSYFTRNGIDSGNGKVANSQNYTQPEFKSTVLDPYKQAGDHYSNAITNLERLARAQIVSENPAEHNRLDHERLEAVQRFESRLNDSVKPNFQTLQTDVKQLRWDASSWSPFTPSLRNDVEVPDNVNKHQSTDNWHVAVQSSPAAQTVPEHGPLNQQTVSSQVQGNTARIQREKSDYPYKYDRDVNHFNSQQDLNVKKVDRLVGKQLRASGQAGNDEALQIALDYAAKGAEIGGGGDIAGGAYTWARNIFGKGPAEKALGWVQKISAGQSSTKDAVDDLHGRQERQAFNFLLGAANRTADRRTPAEAVKDAQTLLATTGLAVPDGAGGSTMKRADAALGAHTVGSTIGTGAGA